MPIVKETKEETNDTGIPNLEKNIKKGRTKMTRRSRNKGKINKNNMGKSKQDYDRES